MRNTKANQEKTFPTQTSTVILGNPKDIIALTNINNSEDGRVQAIVKKIKERLIMAYLCFKLSTESDSWTKTNIPQRPSNQSQLQDSWLFQSIHQMGIITLCSIVEKRKRNESANLGKLQGLSYEQDAISDFYNKNKENIEKIKDIRDQHIAHTDIKPKDDGSVDSYETTESLIYEIANLFKTDLSEYDYHYKQKIEEFTYLCIQDLGFEVRKNDLPNINMNQLKNELIEMMSTGGAFNIYGADINTFKWVHNYGNPFLGLQIGSGNFTVALISVTTLALLAKCYVLLKDNVIPNSTAKRKLKNIQMPIGYKDINETDAVMQLLDDLDNNWGFEPKEIKEFWTRVRHRLIHTAYPYAFIYPPHFTERPNKPFRIDENGNYHIFPDHLWTKYMELKGKIIEKIKADEFVAENIARTIAFVNGEVKINNSK